MVDNLPRPPDASGKSHLSKSCLLSLLCALHLLSYLAGGTSKPAGASFRPLPPSENTWMVCRSCGRPCKDLAWLLVGYSSPPPDTASLPWVWIRAWRAPGGNPLLPTTRPFPQHCHGIVSPNSLSWGTIRRRKALQGFSAVRGAESKVLCSQFCVRCLARYSHVEPRTKNITGSTLQN